MHTAGPIAHDDVSIATSLPQTRRVGRPRTADAPAKRTAIIEAALAEFVASGFRGASMRRIAESCGMSTRTLYNHFRDKTGLFAASLDYCRVALDPIALAQPGDLESTLVTCACELQRQLSRPESRTVALLLYREGAEYPELREISTTHFGRHMLDIVAEVLKVPAIQGDTAALARHFVALATGEWQRRLIFGEPPLTEPEIEAHAHEITGLFLRGAAAPPC